MGYHGKTAALRSIWRDQQRRYCDKCHESVFGGLNGGDEGLAEHSAECAGRFRYYCHHCVRFVVLSKPAIRAHIAGHGNWVDEYAMSKLKPVKVITR